MASLANKIISNNQPGAQPDNKGRNFYMITPIQFEILSLLEEKDDNTVTGTMSPLLFANEIAALTGIEYNRLARVWFKDATVLQKWESGEMTGYDHLIMGYQDPDELSLSLWVDLGTGGMPVAICYQSDKKCVITPLYHETEFLIKLSEEDIKNIFQYVFDHPECIAIRQKE